MAEYRDREHFIPLRRSELVQLLCGQLSPDEGQLFRNFCDRLCDRIHLEFHRLLERLKDDYAPFDPDSDTTTRQSIEGLERERRVNRLFEDVDRLLAKANFIKMTTEEVLACQHGASNWGLDMSIDLAAFSHFALYTRGKMVGRRVHRGWRTWFRKQFIEVDMYQRLVLILQQSPHWRLGKDADTRSVFMKVFKEIPRRDVEMLIPGARIQMPKLDRGKLGVSFVSGLGMLGWTLFKPMFTIAKAAAGGAVAYGPIGIIAALFGYGYRQYYGYQFSMKSYNLKLAQSLYYQNLDNNAGVLFRLLDSAEEQEGREAILAYFYLQRYAGEDGMTPAELDDLVERELENMAGIKVDFEIDDALRKLDAIGLSPNTAGRYRALPVAEALAILQALPTRPVFAAERVTS